MDKMHESVLTQMRTDFPVLDENLTVGEALEQIRRTGLGEKIVYFYAVNREGQLCGVIPTRRLLTTALETRLADTMIADVVAIPESANVLEAAEFFVQHRFMAFPVVDSQRHIRGVVDVGLFTEGVYDLAERREVDDLFQLIGLRLSQLQALSPWRVFGYRFRWLVATLISGLFCAALTSLFEVALAQAIVLAFFMALILGLAESVSMQSMTVTLQQLHLGTPSLADFLTRLRREFAAALLLGAGCGAIVGTVAWLWRGQVDAALAIGGSIFGSMVLACLLGLSVPTLLHRLELDPKIAAGPLTLAMVDLGTLTLYLNAARWVG